MEERVPIEPTIFGAAWRHRGLVVAILVVSLAAGYLYAMRGSDVYVAESTLVVRDPKDVQVFGSAAFRSDPQRYAADQVEILESLLVAERAAELMQPDVDYGVEDVLSRRAVFGDTESGAITIEFSGDTAEAAKLGADSIAEAYRLVLTDRANDATEPAVERLDEAIAGLDARVGELRDQIATLLTAGPVDALPSDARATYDSLNAELQATITERSAFAQRRTQIEVDSALTGVGIGAFSPALLPGPAESGPVRPMAIAGVLGLMVGVSVSYLRALSRRRFENRAEPAAVLDAPLLADVPDFGKERLRSRLPVAFAAASASAESFRFAAAALDVGAVGDHGRSSLAVVSSLAGEGKSTIVANTALALAQQGRRVVVVDGDIANQGLSRLVLGEDPTGPGLVDLLHDGGTGAIRSVYLQNGITIGLLTAGQVTGAPTEVFRAVEQAGIIPSLEREFDFVLVDSPPLLQVAYATALVSATAGTVVVVPHESSIAELEELADRLRLVGAHVAGYIYNRAPLRPEVSTTVGSIAAHRRASAAAAERVPTGNGSKRSASRARQLQ